MKNKQLKITRDFDAPVKQVWNAWTQSELLDQWWAPKPWKPLEQSYKSMSHLKKKLILQKMLKWALKKALPQRSPTWKSCWKNKLTVTNMRNQIKFVTC